MSYIVTIGLCVKNAEKTIRNAIKGILNQTFPLSLVEVIVVDGFSNDKTLSIIKEMLLGERKIMCRIFYENDGLGTARQIVVDNALGDYIVWVDGDMIIERDFIKKQVEFMEKNPKVAIAGGKFKMYNEKSLVARVEGLEWMTAEKISMYMSEPILNCCAGTIHRVEAIKKIGGFDKRIKGAGEDIDLGYRLCKAGWMLYFTTDACFTDERSDNLLSLWRKNFWYGYGGHFLLHKHGGKITHSPRFAALSSALSRAFTAYKLSYDKAAFLIPFLYLFKKVAWLLGFLKAHLNGYGHSYTTIYKE